MRPIIAYSEYTDMPETIGVVGGKGDDEQRVILFTGNESVVMNPRQAVSLGLSLIRRAIAEVVGL